MNFPLNFDALWPTLKKTCYDLQDVGETTWIVAADKEEEGRGNSLILMWWVR
jgi:hypothetical protein